jgi:chromosome segregation ATPase
MSDSDQTARGARGLSPEALRFLDSGSLPVRGPPPDSKPSAGEQELLAAARRGAQALAQDMERFTDTLRALAFSTGEASTRMDELRRTHLELQAELERAHRVLAEREQLANTLANRLSELAAELALQQGQWKDAETQLASAHARSQAALEARIAELDAARIELKAAVGTEQAEKVALAGRITELEAEFETDRTLNQAAFDARLAAREAELQAEYARERAGLESSLAELEGRLAQTLERLTRAERERAFSLEEQDRFVKSVVDEYEEKLTSLTRSRDEAVGRAEQLARQAGASRGPASSAPTLQVVAPQSEGPAPLALRVRELEEQLEQIQHERELSREVLRRLQLQRDEAQETATRLTRQVEALRRTAETEAASLDPHGRKPAGVATLPELPRVTPPVPSEPSNTAGGPTSAPSASRPPEVERSPAPSSPRSALAAALAASDPTHRRRQADAVPASAADAKAPPSREAASPERSLLGAKPELSARPLVGYSKRDVEPDDVRPKPPRRHGG